MESILFRNVGWAPKPNTLYEAITNLVPDENLCSSAFVIPFDSDGNIVLSNVRKRGIDIPGGHVEVIDGVRETPEQAAIREAKEECGITVTNLVPIGYRKYYVPNPPENYRYTTPYSYQVFFTGIVTDYGPVLMPDECGDPHIVQPDLVSSYRCIRNHKKLFKEAIKHKKR